MPQTPVGAALLKLKYDDRPGLAVMPVSGFFAFFLPLAGASVRTPVSVSALAGLAAFTLVGFLGAGDSSSGISLAMGTSTCRTGPAVKRDGKFLPYHGTSKDTTVGVGVSLAHWVGSGSVCPLSPIGPMRPIGLIRQTKFRRDGFSGNR